MKKKFKKKLELLNLKVGVYKIDMIREIVEPLIGKTSLRKEKIKGFNILTALSEQHKKKTKLQEIKNFLKEK